MFGHTLLPLVPVRAYVAWRLTEVQGSIGFERLGAELVPCLFGALGFSVSLYLFRCGRMSHWCLHCQIAASGAGGLGGNVPCRHCTFWKERLRWCTRGQGCIGKGGGGNPPPFAGCPAYGRLVSP